MVSTAGTTNIKQLTEANAARNLGITIIPAKDHAEAFLMVETDRAAAFVMDDILLASFVAGSKDAGRLRHLQGCVLQARALRHHAAQGRSGLQEGGRCGDRGGLHLAARARSSTTNGSWQKIPPKGLNLNTPIGPELKAEFAKPSDSPDPDSYKAM